MKSYDLEFWSALYSPFCYGHNVRWRWSKSINNALESATAAAIKYNRIAQLIINTCGVPSMQTINYMCVYVSRAFEGMPRQVVRYCFRSAVYLISFTLRYIFLFFHFALLYFSSLCLCERRPCLCDIFALILIRRQPRPPTQNARLSRLQIA